MDTIVIVGYIAGTLTTLSFVPQVARAWKLKETRDLSLAMLLLFAAGILLWTVYGIWIRFAADHCSKRDHVFPGPAAAGNEDTVPLKKIINQKMCFKKSISPEGAQGSRRSCRGGPGASW